MIPIPPKLKYQMRDNPYYYTCARNAKLHDHVCEANPVTGRLIEWEHAIKFDNKRLQQIWAIIPICWWSHEGPGKNKEINVWLALNRASEIDLKTFSKAENLIQKRDYLNKKYGKTVSILE